MEVDYEPQKEIVIKNTRVIVIDENTEIDAFKDVKYVVEFVAFGDYYGTDGKYTVNIDMYNSYVIYKDNTCECERIVTNYAVSTYDMSFPMIKKMVDLGTRYNRTITVK